MSPTIFQLLAVYHRPDTHPVVVEQCRDELARRGVFPGPRNEDADHVLAAHRDLRSLAQA